MLLALSQGFFGPIHYIGTSIMYSSTCLLKQDAKMHIEVIMHAFAIVSEFFLALNFIFTVFLLGLFILTGYNILSIQLLWTSKISL